MADAPYLYSAVPFSRDPAQLQPLVEPQPSQM